MIWLLGAFFGGYVFWIITDPGDQVQEPLTTFLGRYALWVWCSPPSSCRCSVGFPLREHH